MVNNTRECNFAGSRELSRLESGGTITPRTGRGAKKCYLFPEMGVFLVDFVGFLGIWGVFLPIYLVGWWFFYLKSLVGRIIF